jgi:cobaltochelatase CobN
MHILLRERHGLEETAAAEDLGHAAADLVVLSFSDSDLAAFASAWRSGRETLPSLRLANLRRLAHPLSVDLYLQNTLSGARGILIRLLGGVDYWRYGVEQVSALAAAKGIALAIVPGDGRPDPRLDAASNLPPSTLRRLKSLCDSGGPDSARAALAQLALAAGLPAVAPTLRAALPRHGFYACWWCFTAPFSPPPTPIRSTG